MMRERISSVVGFRDGTTATDPSSASGSGQASDEKPRGYCTAQHGRRKN